MTNDILILAAGLGDVVASGLSDGTYSGYNIAASNDPDGKLITDLAIFKPIQYVLKVVSLFMLMLFGWKLITALTSAKEKSSIAKAITSNIGFLIAAVLLWDISIFLSLLGVIKTAATALAASITSLVSNVK
jgi:hypothetical protein